MELLEAHFNTLDGNLIYDESTDTYEMFSNKSGINKHINYLTFKRLFKVMGTELSFEDEILNRIAERATQSEFGARYLKSILHK